MAAVWIVAFSCSVSSATASQPKDFFGVVAQGPLVAKDYERMGSGNVGSLRIPISWAQTQPAAGEYRWEPLDSIIGQAASAGVDVLPFVYSTPRWVENNPSRPPIDSPEARNAWRSFLAELVGRYGTSGTFWDSHPDPLPIRRWQMWNEPNFPIYWQPRPSAREYAQLLEISAETIRATDGRAKIVAAGVAPVTTGPWPWDYMADLYDVPGVERYFDEAALHPYSRELRSLRLQVRRVRRVMQNAGDGATPLTITELGWPSRLPRGVPGATPRTQARNLSDAFSLLQERRKVWNISGVNWFSWQDAEEVEPGCNFCPRAGLFKLSQKPKPAWREFKHFSKQRTTPSATADLGGGSGSDRLLGRRESKLRARSKRFNPSGPPGSTAHWLRDQ